MHASFATQAETAQAAVLVAELRRLHASEADVAARKTRVLAEAFALAEAQTARIVSTRSKEREMPLRSLAAELALATRANDRTMQGHMFDAHRLVTGFPSTLAALECAEISRAHATVILDAGAVIDEPSARAAFESAVLAYAASTTAARTRAYARQQAEIHNPRTMQERHDAAMLDRRVWVTDLDDGTAMLGVIHSTVVIHGIYDRLNRQAKAIKAVDASTPTSPVTSGGSQPRVGEAREPASEAPFVDERTIDQVRADLVADLVLTGTPAIDPTRDLTTGCLGAIRATVQITVPVTTLTGITPSGAELDGIAPIDPETAKCLACDAPGWDRVLTDPISGIVLAVDRYQPVQSQRRFLNARDRHCRFPGCRRPARYCDHDHTIDWALGGPTAICNLACLCERHHTLKHASDWTVRQLPGGVLEWTSPLGEQYVDTPTPRVVFVPSGGEPPPF